MEEGAGCPVTMLGIKPGEGGGSRKMEVVAVIGSKDCRWKWRREEGTCRKVASSPDIGTVGRIRIDDLSSIVTISKCSWRWFGDRCCVAELCSIVVSLW